MLMENGLIYEDFHGIYDRKKLTYFNPFVPNTPFLYPHKTSENRNRERIGDEWNVHWERFG